MTLGGRQSLPNPRRLEWLRRVGSAGASGGSSVGVGLLLVIPAIARKQDQGLPGHFQTALSISATHRQTLLQAISFPTGHLWAKVTTCPKECGVSRDKPATQATNMAKKRLPQAES